MKTIPSQQRYRESANLPANMREAAGDIMRISYTNAQTIPNFALSPLTAFPRQSTASCSSRPTAPEVRFPKGRESLHEELENCVSCCKAKIRQEKKLRMKLGFDSTVLIVAGLYYFHLQCQNSVGFLQMNRLSVSQASERP